MQFLYIYTLYFWYKHKFLKQQKKNTFYFIDISWFICVCSLQTFHKTLFTPEDHGCTRKKKAVLQNLLTMLLC